ncbi:hypothetical protein [Streptomyces sp. sk2.1]|uniref:RNA polymerase sigma factor n=1 Tax=Streptomyces sp. sk2.1 TaxID=2478959 RepID=UPI0011E7C7F0|nr:hypothetical protein [Streptomyces sp. sk2.1]
MSKTKRSSSQVPGSAGGELPLEIQQNVDRVDRVVAAGFQGREWEQLADELYVYAYKTLHVAMRKSFKLMALIAHSETPLVLSSEEGSALHSNFDDRAVIATMTISEAMRTLPSTLRKGGYDPAANPGKDNKYKSLASFFVGRCGLVFPRAFSDWRRERADRFVTAVNEHKRGWILSGVLHPAAVEPALAVGPAPDDVIVLCSTLTAMIDDLKPRNRAVWHMVLEGCSRDEVSEALGIKLGNVDNALYTFRNKVRKLRREGKLVVPPPIEAEWERRRNLDVATATNGEGR